MVTSRTGVGALRDLIVERDARREPRSGRGAAGYSRAMRITIDAAGRVVIPKSMRDALGLSGGRPIEIREREGVIEIEPAATPMRLEKREGAPRLGSGSRIAAPDRRSGPCHLGESPALMLAVDTSVVVAAFATWHDGHGAALAALDRHPTVACARALGELLGADEACSPAQDVSCHCVVVSGAAVRGAAARACDRPTTAVSLRQRCGAAWHGAAAVYDALIAVDRETSGRHAA